MAFTQLQIEPIENFARTHIAMLRPVGIETSRPANQQFRQLQARLVLDPYLIQNGQPVADSGFGVMGMSTAYADAGGVVVTQGFPTPPAAVTGADYRFLADTAYTAVGGGGVKRWFPVGGSVSTYPQLLVRPRTGVEDPVIAPAYVYESRNKKISRPAYTMNTKGYFEIQTANGSTVNYTQAAMLMVFVPHGGPGAYYPLYDSGPITTSQRRFAVRYRKGRIQITASGTPLLQHQVYINHSEPIIVAFVVDATTNVGKFVCADRRRTSRTFNVSSIAGMDMNAWIGVEPTTPGGGTPNYAVVADMDILEIDMWLGKTLDFRQLEAVVTQLSKIYKVGAP
jgi:hypothetical protein